MAGELAEVERRLAGLARDAAAPLPALTTHLVGSGGKRVRPLILLLAARSCDVPPAVAVPLACAAELVHSASLLHDDVVDEATTRRGQQVAHRIWGNAPAVLGGDYCLASAMAQIASVGRPEPVSSMAETVQRLAQGELLQLRHRARRQEPVLDASEYFRVLDHKTTALIVWCARVGGLLSPDHHRALGAYGRALGRAFQITDDVLDYLGDPDRTGKDTGADLREGKVTLPLMEACRRRPALTVRLQEYLCSLHPLTGPGSGGGRPPVSGELPRSVAPSVAPFQTDGAASGAELPGIAREILQQVRDCGGVDAARAQALAAARQARSAVAPLPPTRTRDALADLARFCADRLL